MASYSSFKIGHVIGVRTLKTGIGAALAMIIAKLIGLMYWPSAGIITILSIQATKRQSVELAMRRIVATVIALIVAAGLFVTLGYSPVVFGIYLLIFIPIAARFELADGIVMASVLVTHLMGEGMVGGAIMANEMGLVAVGVGVALVLNLYMPSIEGELAQCRQRIEGAMYELFCALSSSLRAQAVPIGEEQLFRALEHQVIDAQGKAYKYANNYLFATASPYEKYFGMRARQLQIMSYMREHYSRLSMTYQETEIVADFALKVASSIKGEVTAKQLLEELGELRTYFKQSPLPKTREEFENRAMLYQFLNDLEHFLEIKRAFKESLTEQERGQYEEAYKAHKK
ncbi:MAG: aromatic acid exporter family protein [Cellulosilyticaceae bacterium]